MYKVGNCVKGRGSITESDLDPRYSSFGKRYENEGRASLGHLGSFNNLSSTHKKIHVLAKEAVRAAAAKDGRASALYNELAEAVKEIHAAIDMVKRESLKNGSSVVMHGLATTVSVGK